MFLKVCITPSNFSEKGDAQGASTPGKFQRLSASIAARNEKSEKKAKVEKKVKLEVTERKENDGVMDSDEDQLVVDENPKPKRQPGLSTSTTKPGSLKLKLSSELVSRSRSHVGFC